MTPPARVAIVIPAYNAADTLGDTLASVEAQTLADWEVILVDDGSTDDTGRLGVQAAAREPRVRYVRQANAGMGLARNRGLAECTAPWVVFLDSDDWLVPNALAAFAEQGALAPGAEVILGDWSRVAVDGTVTRIEDRPTTDRLFEVVAAYCPWAIHSACVSARLLRLAGGFHSGRVRNTSHDGVPRSSVCADWDLWQRLARMGARFTRTPVEVARYRTRPLSAVMQPWALLQEGLALIDVGHRADPRVSHPDPRYANGRDLAMRPAARLMFASWPAAMLIGMGEDARPVLARVSGDVHRELEPGAVAASIYQAALLPTGAPPQDWPGLYPERQSRIADYLAALEETSGTRSLAARAIRALERKIVQSAVERGESVQVGGYRGIVVEVTAPIPTTTADADVDRLLCQVRLEGTPLGILELPVADGELSAPVLADAIVAHHAWPILGAFFGRTVYPDCQIDPAPIHHVRRSGVQLGTVPGTGGLSAASLHDAVGWTVFLQEFWGERDWDRDHFYRFLPPDSAPALSGDTLVQVELSSDDFSVGAVGSVLEASVGGYPVLIFPAPLAGPHARHTIIGAATQLGGYELCRVAVREALLGRSLDEPGTLRQRLVSRASDVWRASDRDPRADVWDPRLAPGWRRAAPVAQGAHGILARWPEGPSGTSASRRVSFAAAATPELLALAWADKVPVRAPAIGRGIDYEPGVFWVRSAPRAAPPRQQNDRVRGTAPARVFDRHHFEAVFAAEADPWRYQTAFEQRKYEQTLSLVPNPAPRRALEIACAEGEFSRLLAARVGHLTATDISTVALDRAALRCAGVPNVTFARLDFAVDDIAGPWDLITCSEVLYYLQDHTALAAVARRLAAALAPGGVLVMAHCNVAGDDPTETGLDWDVPFGAKVIGSVFTSTKVLALEHEIRTPVYRIQRFRRRRSTWLPDFSLVSKTRVEASSHEQLPSGLLTRFVSGRGSRAGGRPRALTYRLPILQYHQVAPSGSEAFRRYRTTPAAFEEHLRYLRDAGFRGVTLDDWRRAMERWEPLPGRNVVLTFDDASADFAEFAWPLLKRYGFTALLFAVTDFVGGTNEWDAHYGEATRLLSWEALRSADQGGIQVGSHSATHPFLTAMSPSEVVREVARSRRVLQQELGHPVTTFAYPHGAEDPAVQLLVGGCGFQYALSGRPGPSNLTDPLLALPRIEITGDDTLTSFIHKLST